MTPNNYFWKKFFDTPIVGLCCLLKPSISVKYQDDWENNHNFIYKFVKFQVCCILRLYAKYEFMDGIVNDI